MSSPSLPPLGRRSWLHGAGLSVVAQLLACAPPSHPERGSQRSDEKGSPVPDGNASAPPAPARRSLVLVDREVSDYCADHSVAESPVMAAIAEQTRATTDMWIMMVGPMEAALLRLLVRLRGARRVLEVGTFTGYSAIAMAEGLPDDGTLVTLDISEEWTAIAKEHWARSPHGKKIELRLGPAIDTLATLAAAKESFDLAFVDADKGGYPAYWDAIVPMISAGGLVVVDNVLAGGNVADPQSEHARGMAAFNDQVRADTRVQTLMLPLRDGVTIAQKLG